MSKLGTKRPKYFHVQMNAPHQTNNESLIILAGGRKCELEENHKWFIGIGKVVKILKGDEFDIICVNFGRGIAEEVLRKIIVKSDMARKQIATIKINQYADFFGDYVGVKLKQKDGTYKYESSFIAYAIRGWYVPRAYDIKRTPKEELPETEQMDSDEYDYTHDILSQFML